MSEPKAEARWGVFMVPRTIGGKVRVWSRVRAGKMVASFSEEKARRFPTREAAETELEIMRFSDGALRRGFKYVVMQLSPRERRAAPPPHPKPTQLTMFGS